MATNQKQPTKISSSATMESQSSLVTPNLESFACFWLDQDVNSTQDNRDTQQELRQVINHLRTFDNADKCEQYIQQITQEKIILIVSGSLGRQVVPRLHDLPQFSACYVFCRDKEANEKWANKHHKVKGVFVQRATLVARISEDQITRAKLEDGASISVISHGSQSLQSRNAIFMWFQLFIEVLLRMHHKSTDRKELIDICKRNYAGNHQEMSIISELEKNYKAENSIWWYTRESCFYRMMNKALRVQDYDILFAFRFFITDIAKQIKSEHKKFIRTSDTRNMIRVYRGSAIGSDELELMKNSVGEFLSMNSFLSTSRNRLTALQFARTVSSTANNMCRVVFEVDIDPRLETKAFADITSMSYFQHEDEVLIILGALFRIEKIIEDKKDRIWVVRVSLAGEDDYQLKETFAYFKEKIEDDTTLDSLGQILFEMGEYEQARKCYKRMLEEGQLTVGDAQFGLGRVCRECGETDESLEHLKHAIEIRKQILGQDHADVGQNYRLLGLIHSDQQNYDESLINLKKSIGILEKAIPSNSFALARSYSGMASVYYNMEQHTLAMEYYKKALKIQQAILPKNHPETALTFNNLGCVHDKTRDFAKALEYYQKSLDISRKTLPPTHEDFVLVETNITRLKAKMKT